MTNTEKLEAKSFGGQIVGPISLIFTLFLAGKAHFLPNYDLAIIAVLGLFFCAKWRLKGCFLALGFLAATAAIKHLFFLEHHVWQAGFEASVALAFIITALVFRETALFTDGMIEQNLANSKTIEFLEDDLEKLKQSFAQEASNASEKIIQLQSQLDEALTESSSYQILNDVLRKSTAKAIDERDLLSTQITQSERRAGQLLSEIDVLQKELGRIGNESLIVQQNGQLFKELNESRVKEAQTHLVNETLARMHRNENARVKEFEAKCELLAEQLAKTNRDLEESAFQIEELHVKGEELSSAAQRQYIALSEKSKALEEELLQSKAQFSSTSDRYEELQSLYQTLAAKALEQASELEAVKQQILAAPPSITPEREADLMAQVEALTAEKNSLSANQEDAKDLKERLQILQTRLEQYHEVELLYRQLKGNFQEKNKVLHETRVELFHVDTELQTLKQQLEESRLEGEPLLPEMTAEIEEIEKENKDLSHENKVLNEIISQLMASHTPHSEPVHSESHSLESAGLVKKKVKKKKVLAEQQDLFIIDDSL